MDREAVPVGPAAVAQVEDRLAGAVAGELGLGAVGVEDAQVGDDVGVLRAGRAAGSPSAKTPKCGGAELAHARGRQLEGRARRARRSGSRCRGPATSRTSYRAGSLEALPPGVRTALRTGSGRSPRSVAPTGSERQCLRASTAISARGPGLASGDVEQPNPGELAHPGELAPRVVAGAALHRLDVAAEQLVEAERLASGDGGAGGVCAQDLLADARGEHRSTRASMRA